VIACVVQAESGQEVVDGTAGDAERGIQGQRRPERSLSLGRPVGQPSDLVRRCAPEAEVEDTEVAEDDPDDRENAVAGTADPMQVWRDRG